MSAEERAPVSDQPAGVQADKRDSDLATVHSEDVEANAVAEMVLEGKVRTFKAEQKGDTKPRQSFSHPGSPRAILSHLLHSGPGVLMGKCRLQVFRCSRENHHTHRVSYSRAVV